MTRPLLALLCWLSTTVLAAGDSVTNPVVEFETSVGNFAIELFANEAPLSTKNFLGYVERGFYDDTCFHRVIPDFVVQGGGYTPDLVPKETREPVANEADNGLRNTRGTLSMARTSDPDSATSQFFINLADNPYLDHSAPTLQGWGYAVFGRIIEGMAVVDAMAAQPTSTVDGMPDVPTEPIVVTHARLRTQP